MSTLQMLILDSEKVDVWLTPRADGLRGSGVAADPWNVGIKYGNAGRVGLSRASNLPTDFEATATTTSPHGLANGDLVEISGAENNAYLWNGLFGVYGVTETSFKYFMRGWPTISSASAASFRRVTLLFDEVMRQMPEHIKVHLGPGIFLTRGFALNDNRGWQPKSGQVILGMGMDVTTIQLVGADMPDEHYHAVGTGIAGDVLRGIEICDLTIDANVGNQPGRPVPGYADVACGAIRIVGDRCAVRRVKAVNWGTMTLKQGCFGISLLHATVTPGDGGPLVREYRGNCIEDCIAILPSRDNA